MSTRVQSDPQADTKSYVFAGSSSGDIPVRGGDFLFSSDFSRAGPDLVLVGNDGTTVVIVDYFAAAVPANLVSETGGILTGEVVLRLAGPAFPAQYAQSAPATALGPAIGQVETASGTAVVRHTDGTTTSLRVGDRVFQGDVIEAASNANVSITFQDRSVLSISNGGRLVLDQYVYSPGGSSNSMLVNVVQGLFAFVAGQIAPTGTMRIETPVASMGVRGTTGIVQVEVVSGISLFTLLNDFDGGTGQLDVFNKTTGGLLRALTAAGDSLLVRTAAGDSSTIAKSTEQLSADQQAITLLSQAFTSSQDRIQRGEEPVSQPPPSSPFQRRGALDGPTDLALSTSGIGQTSVALLGDISGLDEADQIDGVDGLPFIPAALTLVLPANATVIEDGSVVVTGVQLSDPTGGLVSVTVEALSTVSLASTAGLTFSTGDGIADEVVSFSGTAAAATAALDGLTYFPTPDNDVAGGLRISANNAVSTVTGEISVTIEPVNDPPTATAIVRVITEDGPLLAADLLADANASDVDTGDVLAVVDPAVQTTSNDGRVLVLGVDYLVVGAAFELTRQGLAQFSNLGDGDSDEFVVSYGISDGTVTVENSLVISVTGIDDGPPGVAFTTAPVFEAALDGPPETVQPGSNPASDGERTSGTIEVLAPDGLHSVIIGGVELTPAGLAELPSTIATRFGTLVVTGFETIATDTGGTLFYTYTLAGNVSHADGDVREEIALIVNDADGQSAATTLTIDIIDDGPIANSVATGANSTGRLNLVFAIDVSGSMGQPAGGAGGDTRLDLAKASIAALLASANVGSVLIVAFADGAESLGWFSDVDAAIAAMDGLTAEGQTNYDAALDTVVHAYTADRPPDADGTLVYFLSDGDPTRPSGSVGIDAAEQTEWEAFLTDPLNAIDAAFAVAIGDDIDTSELEPIAFPNEDSAQTLVATDDGALVGTVTHLLSGATGNVLTDQQPDAFGADGGTILSITVQEADGLHAYSYDPATGTISRDGSVVVAGGTFDAVTAIGGTFSFDFGSGAWTYSAPREIPDTAQQEVFTYTLVDGDGDTASATLSLAIYPDARTFIGTSGNDELAGTGADDLLTGLAGNDVLAGNGGFDVLLGGDGRDRLVVSDTAFNRLDGGSGQDTLALDGGGLFVDLVAISDQALHSIEAIDLTGTGDNRLALSAGDVFELSETVNLSFVDAVAADNVVISGGGGDAVDLVPVDGGEWVAGGETLIEGEQYAAFNFVSGSDVLASVAIDAQVTVNANVVA